MLTPIKSILAVFVLLTASFAFAEEICGRASKKIFGGYQIQTQSGDVDLDSEANINLRSILQSQGKNRIDGQCLCVDADRNYESATVSNVRDAWTYNCWGS